MPSSRIGLVRPLHAERAVDEEMLGDRGASRGSGFDEVNAGPQVARDFRKTSRCVRVEDLGREREGKRRLVVGGILIGGQQPALSGERIPEILDQAAPAAPGRRLRPASRYAALVGELEQR